jgi:hypothetical protein
MAVYLEKELKSHISTKSKEELEQVLYDLLYFAKIGEEVNWYMTDSGKFRMYYENSGESVFSSDEFTVGSGSDE